MKPWTNGDGKRVCDVSEDMKVILIERKGQYTEITAKPDGTLKIQNLERNNETA